MFSLLSLLYFSAMVIVVVSSDSVSHEGSMRNLTGFGVNNKRKNIVSIDSDMPSFLMAPSPTTSYAAVKQITLIMSNSYGGEMPVGAISTKAMEIALEQLRKQPNWLPNYDIALELVDDECVDSTTINRVVPLLQLNDVAFNRFPLFLSPTCESFGQQTVAEVIKYYNFVGISTIQTSLAPFRNRQRFSNYFSLGEQANLAHIALAEFIAKMGWKKIAILSEAFPYYDELETTFMPLLDEKNVTVLWRGKLSHAGVFDDEMRLALDEMIAFDPRIIVVNADRGAGKACWLHRYGLYGPNYVTFFFYWSDVYPTPAVPDNMVDWCTVEMINQVLASSFILGDTTITDTFGKDIEDSSGITGKQWERLMEERVIRPQDSPLWGYWRMLPYDLTLFAGYLLNTTEALLKQRNETLLDWVTTSDKFRRNGSVIADVLKEALYMTKVKGLKGEYLFEKNTTVNSLGYTPVTITHFEQRQNVLIAIYKSNEKAATKFHLFTDRIKWLSGSLSPPNDSLQIVRKLVPIVSDFIYAAFAVWAILAIFVSGSVIFIAIFRRKLGVTFRRRFRTVRFCHFQDYALVGGNFVMLCAVFAMPQQNVIEVSTNCNMMLYYLIIGYSTSIFGLILNLERGRYLAVLHMSPPRILDTTSKTIKPFALWLTVNTILTAVLLQVSPIKTETIEFQRQEARLGVASIYQPFQYKCNFTVNLKQNTSALSILCCCLALQGMVLARAAFTAYRLRMGSRNAALPTVLRNSTTSIFCIIILLVAGSFVTVLLGSSHIAIVISVFILGYVTITTGLVIFSKLLLQGKRILPSKSVVITVCEITVIGETARIPGVPYLMQPDRHHLRVPVTTPHDNLQLN